MSQKIEYPNLFAMEHTFFQMLLVVLWLMHIVCDTNIECTPHAWTGSPWFVGKKRHSGRVWRVPINSIGRLVATLEIILMKQHVEKIIRVKPAQPELFDKCRLSLVCRVETMLNPHLSKKIGWAGWTWIVWKTIWVEPAQPEVKGKKQGGAGSTRLVQKKGLSRLNMNCMKKKPRWAGSTRFGQSLCYQEIGPKLCVSNNSRAKLGSSKHNRKYNTFWKKLRNQNVHQTSSAVQILL